MSETPITSLRGLRRLRIRMCLMDLDDTQLRSGLDLTVEDIAVLRTGTKTASPLR